MPSEDEVRALLDRAAELRARAGARPEEQSLVRELIDRLTGGRIDVEQAGERAAQRGWVQGRFRFHLAAVGTRLAGLTAVEIDYRDPEAGLDPAAVEEVQRLDDGGVLIKEIASRTGLSRTAVAKGLDDSAATGWTAGRGGRGWSGSTPSRPRPPRTPTGSRSSPTPATCSRTSPPSWRSTGTR